MQWKRRAVIAPVILAVALALAYGFMPKPVRVETSPARKGRLTVAVREEARTRVTDRYVVSAPVAGYARRVDLKAGDVVSKGQRLLELEPQRSRALDPRSRAEAEARVSAAGASLKAAVENSVAARAEADYAEAELKRADELYRSGYIPRDRHDEAVSVAKRSKAALGSAEFAADVARYELEAARTALKHYSAGDGGASPIKLLSPVRGSVLKVLHESEGAVAEGQPLIEIGDPRAIEVVAEVLSPEAVKIARGTRVIFDRWGGQVPLEGRVRVVEPAGFTKVSALGVEEQRVYVISDFTTDPGVWERLGDGYRVEASFIIWDGDGVLTVPMSALFRRNGGWAVFAVNNGRAALKDVKTGHMNGLTAEVLGGLSIGEEVITHPSDAVEDGKRVSVERR